MKAKRRLALAMSAALGMGAACAPALAEEPSGAAEDDGNYFRLGGYVRGWAAFNLQDIPETKGNDKGKVEGLVKYARSNFMTPIPVAAMIATPEEFARIAAEVGVRRP